MIECVFTLDYEIFGNGTGALQELVYDPAERLRDIFAKWNACFVNFVEVAEFEKIESWGTDPTIGLVKKQIQQLHRNGHEIALHLHPQWCNALYKDGRWLLDSGEYNLCTLPRKRIAEIVERSLDCLRRLVGKSDFVPLSFRAGNWLFQPTEPAAGILAGYGIKIDSSVFKGGLQHSHGLDYRPASGNGYYWSFKGNVNKPDPSGKWIEMPIYAEMVPLWRMSTSKRLGYGNSLGSKGQKWNRLRDFMRFRYPLKFDFCRMTLAELTAMMERIIQKDREQPRVYRPLVAIGHTKDLTEPQVVDRFLRFLREKSIAIVTFADVYPKLQTNLSRVRVSSTLPQSVCAQLSAE